MVWGVRFRAGTVEKTNMMVSSSSNVFVRYPVIPGDYDHNTARNMWRPSMSYREWNPYDLFDYIPKQKTRVITRTDWFAEESYTHKIANGQVYDPEVYVDFYKKFGAKWGSTPTAPRLPNLIGLFPKNIGTSANPYSHYFNVNNPGDKYIQRIPKIKWMNRLVGGIITTGQKIRHGEHTTTIQLEQEEVVLQG